MLKIRVKLFGLLAQRIPGYDSIHGLTLETMEGTTYRDLVGLLQLNPREVGFFSVKGIVRKPDDALTDGEEVNLFMPLAGG
jgi:molybdopterin converting factor small subunit